MAGNEVTLTIAGDATQLQRATERAETAMAEVEASVADTNAAMDAATGQSRDLGARLGSLGAAAEGMSTAIGDAGAAVGALADLQNMSARRADEQARRLLDVQQAAADLEQAYGDLRQAQVDLNQSMLDAKQAGLDATQAQIDAKQAALDASEAQKAYNEAVKEHGAGSAEAKQAAIDLQQAQADLGQANLDAEQAANDLKQAVEDGGQAQRDARQAAIDAKAAQLDLNEAQRAANPGALGRVAQEIEAYTPLLLGAVGVTNLLIMAQSALSLATLRAAAAAGVARVATLASSAAAGVATAAQWLWNIAMTANPIGLIIVAVAALVAAIVWIATQTTWFQTVWEYAWAGIQAYFEFVWDSIFAYLNWVKDNYVKAFNVMVAAGTWLVDQARAIPGRIASAFSGLFGILTAPWRLAFNFIATAWNSTVGKLRWTVPSWVPGVGGNTIAAPTLPKFHAGGRVPGVFGQDVLAVLQAGETVLPTSSGGGGRTVIELRSDGTALGDLLVEILAAAIRRAGGVDVVFGGSGG